MSTPSVHPAQHVKRQAGWSLALGLLIALLGIVAMSRPLMAGVAATIFFGSLLLVAGVSEIVHAATHREGDRGWRLFVGVLRCVAGGMLLFYPLGGLLTLTLIIGAAFLAEGGIQTVMAIATPSMSGRGWILVSGILNLIVGLLILTRWPTDALWVVGLLVGVSLMVNGVTLAVVSGYARSMFSTFESVSVSDAPPVTRQKV